MDKFIQLPENERKAYFRETAARVGIKPQHVEKDFWVCWTLKQLFALPQIGEHLTFKGGTSLSKAYKIIERFSEDIDITISRDYLGFGGSHDPQNAPSGKKRKQWLEELKTACRSFVATSLQTELHKRLSSRLPTTSFDLGLDPQDSDQQTLNFRYPTCWPGETDGYFGKFVRIEMGARSDTWPNQLLPVKSYVAQEYPARFDDAEALVQVLAVERTFWEKAALLHEENCRPTERPVKPRMSRHYSDLERILEKGLGDKVLADLQLLEKVVEHRSVFFAYTWVDYEQMKPGGFKIIPAEHRVAEWKADYKQTEEMFFQPPPSFEKVLKTIAAFERQLNRT